MKRLPLFFLLVLLLAGCREEIIPPGQGLGVLNSPIKDNYYRSYSFRVDASNLNLSVSDSVHLNSSRTQLIISNGNYIRGTLTVNLINQQGTLQYTEVLDDDTRSVKRQIENTNIERIEILFNNFTGNIAVRLDAIN